MRNQRKKNQPIVLKLDTELKDNNFQIMELFSGKKPKKSNCFFLQNLEKPILVVAFKDNMGREVDKYLVSWKRNLLIGKIFPFYVLCLYTKLNGLVISISLKGSGSF